MSTMEDRCTCNITYYKCSNCNYGLNLSQYLNITETHIKQLEIKIEQSSSEENISLILGHTMKVHLQRCNIELNKSGPDPTYENKMIFFLV